MKDAVREWIELAGIDLRAAEMLIRDEELTTIVSFHAHQCVEKSFKAVLEFSDKPVVKIHNLGKLFYDIKNLIHRDFDNEMLVELSRLYIDSRYPSMNGLLPYGKPTIQDTERYTDFARQVYWAIQSFLSNND